MNIIDAIKKAGRGNYITRGKLVLEVGLERDWLHKKGSGDSWCPDMADLIATDWEVIEPVTIEVGDIVQSKYEQGESVVVGENDEYLAVQYNYKQGAPINIRSREDFTLIRKGPKKHVFEGAELRRRGIHPDDYVTLAGSPDDYKTLNQDRLIAFTDNGKTYRMTLEEMP